MAAQDEDEQLVSVALQNASAISRAPQRADQELIQAKEALELKADALAHALAMVRATLESTADGILVTDRGKHVTGFNEKFVELWAVPREVVESGEHSKLLELLSRRLNDPRQFLSRIEDIYVSGAPESFDLLELADGRSLERYSRLQVVDERQVGRVWSFRDVTERNRADITRNLLASVVENSDEAIITKSLEGIISSWNRGAERMFGYTAEEAIGRSIYILIPAEHKAEEPVILERLAKGERIQIYETVRVRKDGSRLRVSLAVSPIRDASGTIVGGSKIARDITARRSAEEARFRLASVVESSDDAIISKTLDGVITSWNVGAERIFGYTAQEAVGQSIYLLIPVERRSEEPAIQDRLRKGERIETYETVRVRKDGTRIEVSLTVSPIRDDNGRIIGASKIARDITARKRAEAERARLTSMLEKLLSSERSARAEAEHLSAIKDDFLATLSHELRTPLSAILGWAQVLLRRVTDDDPEFRRGLETIERNVRVQTRLIEDLLDMSRITSGKLRLDLQNLAPVSFIDAALETVRTAADAKGIRLEKALDPATGPVAGDPNRLQQVVWNLLLNAIKFTPRGGQVQVLLRRVDSQVEICVTDTGIGVSPEFLPHVFERFRQEDASSTRSYGGLGLGLSIVKHVVELHGGTVSARSPGIGLGSTFTVQLPLAQASAST